MTITYDLLASSVLTTTTANVTFSSISSSYRDLILVCNVRSTGVNLRLNSDTGSNYSVVTAYGDGANTTSYSQGSNTWMKVAESDATNRGMSITHFLDANATDKHKSSLTRVDTPTSYAWMQADRWANTSAITSILIFNRFSNNFLAGDSFYLYGIVS